MAEETLRITITADNKSAIDGLKQVSSATQTFVTAQGNLVKGSNQAAQALTNVGRVAQDLPFGFMGIQNNLNPLLESFQRLKTETGSGTTALKALGSSLIGAGGIGLALSVASSAFLIYQNGIAGFNKKATEAKEKLDAFTKSLNSNREAAAQDISSMNAYVSAAQNTALSVEQRKAAVDKLLQQYPESFKGLTVENALTRDLTQVTNSLTEAIYKRAAARAMEADISAKATEVFKEQEKLEKTRLDIEKAQADLASQRKAPTRIGGGGSLGGLSAGTVSGVEIAEKNLVKLLKDQDVLLSSIDNKKQDIAKTQNRINQLTAETINLDIKADKTKVTKESTRTPADISRQAKVTDPRPEQDLVSILDANRMLIKAQNESLDRLRAEQAKNTVAKSLLAGGLIGPKAPQKTQALASYDQEQAAKQQTLLGIEQSRISALDEMNKKFKEQMALGEGIANTFVNMLANIASAPDPFAAIGESLKRLAIDLAATVAKMLIIRAIMTAINPAAGAAKGIGGILGSIIGGVTPFATGGIVTGPTLGLVGEAGNEAILPLDRFQAMQDRAFGMGAMMGGASGGGGVQGGEFVLRGNDMVLMLQRAGYSLNLRR